MTPAARFDDLRPLQRRGFALGPFRRVIAAHRPEDVRPALEAVEAEVRAGRWAGGWVTYEAAPAFDPALAVRAVADTTFDSLPLVWFGVSDKRERVPPASSGGHRLGPWQPMADERHHHDSVAEIRRRIRLGDTYQVNHTFMLESSFEGDVEGFYTHLTRSQSCGYGALVDAGEWAVASASPELFFEWRNGLITCRPMKGTTRRGVDLDDDEAQRSWLERSEKNRAENVMIVDMVRNDLGRVSRIGTVQVPALFTTEKYDTVWQLTSTVTGRPRQGTGLVDVCAALFPSASITGAPKVSTTRIIADLERHPRGVYCGAVGFGGPGPEGPEWAFNVGIRTVLVHRGAGKAFYGTGGGITHDSEPADEYAEALLKAKVLGTSTGELRLLETLRWDPDAGPRHLDRHIARATTSARYFDIPLDPVELRTAVDRATKGLDATTRVRLLVDREGWIDVEATPLTAGDRGPLRLAVDDRPVDRLDPFLHHKTTVRRVYEEAAARHPDADDVVLVNSSGEVTETTIGNLAVELDGRWVTPPTSSGLLAGTERGARLASGELVEAAVSVAELRRASRLARLNGVRGWEPAALM